MTVMDGNSAPAARLPSTTGIRSIEPIDEIQVDVHVEPG